MIKLKNILIEQSKLTPEQKSNIKRFNKLSTNEQKVVATLISEAGGEPNAKDAMTAVYNVLSNRINEPAMKFTKCPNTLVGQATCPSQFSVWNNNNLESLLRNYKVTKHTQLGNAIDIVEESPADITGGATNYWASSGKQAMGTAPRWSRKMIKTKKIGNHQFAYLPDKYTKVDITITDIQNGKKICYMQKTSGAVSAMHDIQTKLGISSPDGKFGPGTAKIVADLLNETYTSYDGLCIGPNTLPTIMNK